MAHDNHTTSSAHLEADHLGGRARARDHFLQLAADWEDPFPRPEVHVLDIGGDRLVNVVREDLLPAGSKARFGSLLVQRLPSKGPLVYVAPRFGFAGISLAWLAHHYGRRLVLFMPACQRISDHQAKAIELGAEPRFLRVAGMPNLNRAAATWALQNGGHFIPLGLRHDLVTAAIVRTGCFLETAYGGPFSRCWTALSTGVLSRGLQIAWPDTEFQGVAVARNIHAGERGDAALSSYHLPFARDSQVMPPFPCASNYDAKAWHYLLEHGEQGDWFWNVAGNAEADCSHTFGVDSNRAWGDDRDLRS